MKQATFTPFPADWARSSHFQYYTKGFVKSVNSMTVRIDVTHFLAEVKRRNLKFFPAFAALTGQVVASIPEMCTAVDENGTPAIIPTSTRISPSSTRMTRPFRMFGANMMRILTPFIEIWSQTRSSIMIKRASR